MAEFRVFGKEVQVRLTRAGVLIAEITAIKDFTFETRQRIVTEKYLGETADRQDEIFEEVGGSFMVHPEGQAILQLQQAIQQRAAARIANPEQVSATFRVSFPNGARPRITVPDMKFDPIPFRAPARDQYVEMSFTFKSDRYLLSI